MSGYYVCKMIGTGAEADANRPAISNYPVDWIMVGQLGRGCLVYVSNPTPELDADPQIVVLSKNLDATFSRNEWNALVTRLHAFDTFDPSDYDATRTVREVIISIGTKWEPSFDINNFSVS